jgi:hypothetical protein
MRQRFSRLTPHLFSLAVALGSLATMLAAKPNSNPWAV